MYCHQGVLINTEIKFKISKATIVNSLFLNRDNFIKVCQTFKSMIMLCSIHCEAEKIVFLISLIHKTFLKFIHAIKIHLYVHPRTKVQFIFCLILPIWKFSFVFEVCKSILLWFFVDYVGMKLSWTWNWFMLVICFNCLVRTWSRRYFLWGIIVKVLISDAVFK